MQAFTTLRNSESKAECLHCVGSTRLTTQLYGDAPNFHLTSCAVWRRSVAKRRKSCSSPSKPSIRPKHFILSTVPERKHLLRARSESLLPSKPKTLNLITFRYLPLRCSVKIWPSFERFASTDSRQRRQKSQYTLLHSLLEAPRLRPPLQVPPSPRCLI